MVEVKDFIRKNAEKTQLGYEAIDSKERLLITIKNVGEIFKEEDKELQYKMVNSLLDSEGLISLKTDEKGQIVKHKTSKEVDENQDRRENILAGVVYLAIVESGNVELQSSLGLGGSTQVEEALPDGLGFLAEKIIRHVIDNEDLLKITDIFDKEGDFSLTSYEIFYRQVAAMDIPSGQEDQRKMVLASITAKMTEGMVEWNDEEESTQVEAKDVEVIDVEVPEELEVPEDTEDTEDTEKDSLVGFDISQLLGSGKVSPEPKAKPDIGEEIIGGARELLPEPKGKEEEDEKSKDTEKKEEIDVLLDKINNLLEENYKIFKKGNKIYKANSDLDLQSEFGFKFVKVYGDGRMVECDEESDTFAFYDKNIKKYFLIPSIIGCFEPIDHVDYYDQKNTKGESCEDGDIFYKIEKPAEVTVLETFKWRNNRSYNKYKLKEKGVARVDSWSDEQGDIKKSLNATTEITGEDVFFDKEGGKISEIPETKEARRRQIAGEIISITDGLDKKYRLKIDEAVDKVMLDRIEKEGLIGWLEIESYLNEKGYDDKNEIIMRILLERRENIVENAKRNPGKIIISPRLVDEDEKTLEEKVEEGNENAIRRKRLAEDIIARLDVDTKSQICEELVDDSLRATLKGLDHGTTLLGRIEKEGLIGWLEILSYLENKGYRDAGNHIIFRFLNEKIDKK